MQSKLGYLESQICNQQNDVVTVHSNQISCIKKEYSQTIDHLTQELNKANTTIVEAETQIRKYKKIIKEQKAQLEDHREEIKTVKQQSEIVKKQTCQKNSIEKQQLVDNYESTIAELTEQTSQLSKDLSKAKSRIEKKEKKLKETKESYLVLKRENAKLVKEASLKDEEYQRENKLHDAAVKNATMLAESQYTLKLNEMKMKWENEKKSLLVYVVDEFHQFFNAKEQIDEKSFKATIQKAKTEIDRLQKTENAIRKMCNVNGQQSTDDAVARIVYAAH